MPVTTFPYRRVPGGTARPTVDVLLTSCLRVTIRYSALVDSGADSCTFPTKAARLLGLDLAQMGRSWLVGVSGSAILTYTDLITIDLGNDILFQTEVGFTDGLNAIGLGLLGQRGLFDRFDVNFQLRRGRVYDQLAPRLPAVLSASL